MSTAYDSLCMSLQPHAHCNHITMHSRSLKGTCATMATTSLAMQAMPTLTYPRAHSALCMYMLSHAHCSCFA